MLKIKEITTEEIIEKYPKIFQDYEGNPGQVNWYGVPDGWLHVIDWLCGAIQDYIDNVTIPKPNQNYVEGSKYDKDDITTHKSLYGHPTQVTCDQMKEKFGGLRFYETGGDERVYGMIKMAEYICSQTCMSCSSMINTKTTQGWISVYCEECMNQK